MTPAQHRRMWILAAVVGGCMLVLYAQTLTQVHTFDALSYILDVARKPWQQLFHPHHLAYGPLGAGLRSLAAGLGSSDVALALQLANAVSGALGVGVFAATVYRRWQRADIALLAALGCGLSYAYWYYAVEVEVYTIATLWSLLVLWYALEPQTERWRWRIGLALSLAAAVLFHQTNALLALPLLVRAWPSMVTGGASRRGWLWAGALAVTTVAAAYTWVIVVVSGFSDGATARAWLFDYVASGWWGGRATASDVGEGIAAAVASQNGGVSLAILVIAALSAAIQQRLRLTHGWLVVWLCTYAVFFTWWEPDNIEFWIGVTPVAVLLLVTPLVSLPRRDPRLWVLAGVLAATAWTNHTAIRLRGDETTDLQRTIATAVAAQSAPDDLLLVPDGLQELYLPYYEGREHFLSVNAAMATHGAWAPACAAIRTAIAATHRAGAQVIVASDFLQPSATMQARYGLDPRSVTDCLAGVLPLLRQMQLPAAVPPHQLLPRAGVLLRDGSYRLFDGQPLGWSVGNATLRPSVTGWWLTVGTDPVLTSPILDIPMPRAFEITLAAADTADRTLQLFVATAPGQFSEQYVVTVAYEAGIQRVHIELPTQTGWPSQLIQLRIDPVADGAGGSVDMTGLTISY